MYKKQHSSIYLTAISLLLLFFLAACTEEPPKQDMGTISTGNPTIDALTKKIIETPDDPTLYAQRGEVYYEAGAYDEAILDLTEALKIDSTNAAYFHLIADAYLDSNNSLHALRTMEYTAKLHPERIPSLLKLSEFQMILKRNNESLKTVDRILKIDPQNAEAYFMMGNNFKDLGKSELAINSYQKAVDNDPDILDAWINLGQLFEELKNPIALRYFDTAIRVGPGSVSAISAKANYLWGLKKYNEAIALYKKAGKIDAQDAGTHYNIGLVYLDMDSIPQAHQFFDLTLKTDPTHIMGYYYRGVASELLGKVESAKNDYQQALNFSPNFTRAKDALNKLNKE